MMNRVLVIGSGGAGKTTFANRLAKLTGQPVIHMDHLCYDKAGKRRPEQAYAALLNDALAQPEWIMEGNYLNTFPKRLARADTVVFLRYSRATCVLGVLGHWIKGVFCPRDAAGYRDKDLFRLRFLHWVWQFNRAEADEMEELLHGHHDKELFLFRHRRDAHYFFKKIGE